MGMWGLALEEGRTSWDLERITFYPPLLSTCCHGDVGRFGFAPHIHGMMEIYLSYEGC